jgi:hypothetical protein
VQSFDSPEVHALGLFAFAQQVRALQVYMVDIIATEYEAKCSVLSVVVNA